MFKLYLLKRLPLAFIAGIAVTNLTNEQSITTVNYKWLTQNPFQSMYFACLAMAAEMSTGLLLLNGIYKSQPTISMLIVKNEAAYFKKAIGKIKFTCNDGLRVLETIKKAKESSESFVIDLTATGIDEVGDVVATFVFTWSLKAKAKKV
ncbi:MAG: DUF4442 domain-containing protein [Bacteroidia bacterium]